MLIVIFLLLLRFQLSSEWSPMCDTPVDTTSVKNEVSFVESHRNCWDYHCPSNSLPISYTTLPPQNIYHVLLTHRITIKSKFCLISRLVTESNEDVKLTSLYLKSKLTLICFNHSGWANRRPWFSCCAITMNKWNSYKVPPYDDTSYFLPSKKGMDLIGFL